MSFEIDDSGILSTTCSHHHKPPTRTRSCSLAIIYTSAVAGWLPRVQPRISMHFKIGVRSNPLYCSVYQTLATSCSCHHALGGNGLCTSLKFFIGCLSVEAVACLSFFPLARDEHSRTITSAVFTFEGVFSSFFLVVLEFELISMWPSPPIYDKIIGPHIEKP